LGCDGRRATPTLALRGKHPRRIPGRHGRTGLHARAEIRRHRDRLSVALLELRRHEPGPNTRPGGDGLPDFLRRAGNLDFDLDRTAAGRLFLYAHDDDSLVRRTRTRMGNATKLFGLARLSWHREKFLDPRLPQRLL